MRKAFLPVYAVSALVGIMTGIVGSLFQVAIRYTDLFLDSFFHFMKERGWSLELWSVLTTLIMMFGAWFMVRYIAPEAAGSGVPEIEGRLLEKRKLYWKRLLPVKFFGGVLAISSKLVLGREGPTIQMEETLAICVLNGLNSDLMIEVR